MAIAYLHSEIKMVSDSRNALCTMAFRIKYFLANHSVIHTVSYKLVHEFASNHYECDLGNVIWKKIRLGFGAQTKIRMASGIMFPANPLPLPSWPPFNWRRCVGGRWYPSLKGPFLQFNLSFQVKAYLLYMRTVIVPLSCFCLHLAVLCCLLFYLEASLSWLAWLSLLNFLVISFILGEEKQKDHYLKKPQEHCRFSPKEFLRILNTENKPKKNYGTKNNFCGSLGDSPCFFVL